MGGRIEQQINMAYYDKSVGDPLLAPFDPFQHPLVWLLDEVLGAAGQVTQAIREEEAWPILHAIQMPQAVLKVQFLRSSCIFPC